MLSRRVQEVKIDLGNEEIDRGAKDFAIISFRIFIQMTSIVNDGYSREFHVSLLDMLQTYLEIKRRTIPLPFTTDSSHLRNHVQHLFQTHGSYLIQWESRLNKSVALRGKIFWITIASVEFKIMEAMESPLSHQQLLTSIPSSLPTSSNGFFIEIHENIIKVDFFIEDDIWALEHHDVCTYKVSLLPRLWRFLDKCPDSTQDLFKHTKPLSTWINRYVHPGVS